MLEKSHSRSSELSVSSRSPGHRSAAEGAEGGSVSMVGAAVSGSHGGWLPLAALEVELCTSRCTVTASGMNVGEMVRAGE